MLFLTPTQLVTKYMNNGTCIAQIKVYLLLLVPGINLELGALANDPCGANPFKENILPTSK